MYSIQQIEEQEFTHTSAAELDQDAARHAGTQRPEQAWILSDRDVWYRNPFYRGAPQPHPEADVPDEDDLDEDLKYRESYPTSDDCPF
jgi:hypothetical protein